MVAPPLFRPGFLCPTPHLETASPVTAPCLTLSCDRSHPKVPGLNPGDTFSILLGPEFAIAIPVTEKLLGDIVEALEAGAIRPVAPYPQLAEVLRAIRDHCALASAEGLRIAS